MSLLALQRGLRDHILAGEARPLAGIGAPAERGLSVYRHAYRAQLVACLRDTFEKTHAWLGDAAFDEVAHAHIAAWPPSSWTLSDYGDGFDATLNRLYPNDLEVVELAWLDWALRRAFDGPDADPITPEALAAVDWQTAHLVLSPNLIVREASTNAAAIWRALAAEEIPPAAERLPEAGAFRVWRVDLTPQYRTIESFERRALELALSGESFAGLCAALSEDEDAGLAAQRVGGLLRSWLQDGLVCSAA